MVGSACKLVMLVKASRNWSQKNCLLFRYEPYGGSD